MIEYYAVIKCHIFRRIRHGEAHITGKKKNSSKTAHKYHLKLEERNTHTGVPTKTLTMASSTK